MRVVVGGGGQHGPFDEITTLSMAGGDCGRGRALWNVRRTTALKWTLGWYPDSFLDPRTSSLEISADVLQPQWLSVHRKVKIWISECEPRRSCVGWNPRIRIPWTRNLLFSSRIPQTGTLILFTLGCCCCGSILKPVHWFYLHWAAAVWAPV